jgi:hypothetical protein
MMKSLAKYTLLVAAFMMLFTTSCDNDFDQVNINPGAAIEINPGFQFSWVLLRTSGERYENWRAGLIYSSMMTQHMAALCGYWSGDKYTYNAGYSSSLFDRAFEQQVRDIQDLINTLETTDRGDDGMLGMAKIWRAVIFHRLTDMYGDIPYSQAGKGFLEGIDNPKYDAQEDIYKDMLNELEQAVGLLNSGGFGTADFIYGGDVAKWKRFGNSLMLRLAMRLSEADAATAQSFVSKAISGGVMQDGDDAFLTHTNGPEGINKNGIGEVLDKTNGFGDDCPRLSQTLVDWMLSTADPRLDILGELPANGGGHNGLPNGLDATLILDNPTGTSLDDFDRVNPALVTVASPMMFMTVAETEFLVAEAIVRGWASGDATARYNNGVRNAMRIYSYYDASLIIDDAAIDAYLSANPFDGSYKQIGEQYWAATFLNEYEAYSNFRRTGYPELTPTTHPTSVTGGVIPKRLAYPQGEAGINGDNLNDALARQNMPSDFASMLTVPVWWDK